MVSDVNNGSQNEDQITSFVSARRRVINENYCFVDKEALIATGELSSAAERIQAERLRFASMSNRRAGQIEEIYFEVQKILEQEGGGRPLLHSECRSDIKCDSAGRYKESRSPVKILAEGDSWFSYPPYFWGGIVSRLEREMQVQILNLASAGDEVRGMLGLQSRARLIRLLNQENILKKPWNFLIFSGGGNDIVGDTLVYFLRDYLKASGKKRALKGTDGILDSIRFKVALDAIKAGYEDLIAIRDCYSPSTVLVFHQYDFAVVNNKGVCGYGPWLQPSFDFREVPNNVAMEVVKIMLENFAEMMKNVVEKKDGIVIVETQGTLNRGNDHWDNELHPTSEGFNRITEKFHIAISKRIHDNGI
jgi:hypothetical protein